VIWQSDVAEESPAWHALAATDHFVVKVDLTVTDAETMTKLAIIGWAWRPYGSRGLGRTDCPRGASGG
jgi:hypothetical protein